MALGNYTLDANTSGDENIAVGYGHWVQIPLEKEIQLLAIMH